MAILSIPERRLIPKFDDFHLLVTQVRSTNRLVHALTTNVLDPIRQHPIMLHSMLTVFEELLYSTYGGGSVGDPNDRGDHARLLSALVVRYPAFLADLHAVLVTVWSCSDGQAINGWQSTHFALHDARRLLQRVVRISGSLGYYFPAALGSLRIDRTCVTHSTLELLHFVCVHEHADRDHEVEDRIAVHRIAYGAACRFTLLNCGIPTPIVPPPKEFVFEVDSATVAAEQMVATLRAASKVFDPPDSVRTVLSMIGDLRYISSQSNFRAGVLAHLREPEAGVHGLLQMLLQKRCKAEAREAIDAIEGRTGGKRQPCRVAEKHDSKAGPARPFRPRLDTTKAGIRLK